MNDEQREGVTADSTPLIRALRRIFQPLARLLISKSIPYTNVADLLRWVFVDVASREFEIGGKAQTDSRVSLLTGVHRREVRRLRRLTSPPFRAPKSATLGSQLVTRWTTQAEYLDDTGKSRALPYMSSDAGVTTFESLVRSVSTDIRPRAVLDEWLRLGVARVDDADRVHLERDAFIPTKGSDELAYYFGRNLHDHLAAGAHNLCETDKPFLERSVHYNNLSPEAVEEIEQLVREEAMRSLRSVNEKAQELQRRDSGTEGASFRVNFGTYFFSEDTASLDEDGGANEKG